MTDLLLPSTPSTPSTPPVSPRARRWAGARWQHVLSGRLVLGVGLMLIAVVVGARVVGGATDSAQWLTTSRPLPAGHVIVADDLQRAAAHLPASAAARYFDADPAALVGRTLTRPLTAGELLPAAAVTTTAPSASRAIPLLVKAGRLPTLAPGARVDVYVLTARRGEAASEVRVLHDVEFVSSDVLSSGDTSIELRVAPGDAIAAVAASQSERVDVVRIERDATGSPGDAGPSSTPAYGG